MRAVAIAALLALLGCSPTTLPRGSTQGPFAERSPLDALTLLRNTVSFSYTGLASPAELLQVSDVALVGEITSVDAALLKTEMEPHGAVIVGLTPTEVWKDEYAPSETVYYWFDRPKNLNAAVYREALPLGTEVVLFADRNGTFDSARFLGKVPAQILSPYPQGLFLATGAGTIESVWADMDDWPEWSTVSTLDDLRTSLGEGV